MKLLFVGTNHGGGGTESHFVTLAKAMLLEGHEVAAVIRPNTPIHLGLIDSGVKIYFGVFRNAIDPRGISAVWRACGDFQPDWMIGAFSKEYWPLAIIAKMRGIKLALFKHMDFPLRFFTHHFIPRLAERFIVISNFMRENFIDRGIAADRIQMLYNPLDTEYFQPNPQLRKASRQLLGINEDDIVVGFIGATHPHKGIFLLADALNLAMAEMPNIKALWVGEGPAAEQLKAHICSGKFESRHIYHNWSPDVRPYYAAMDMLAVPSIANEAFGRVSLEAQASGVPVLCSDRGGLPETLQSGIGGQLLAADDAMIWKDAILNLSRDAKLRTQIQGSGRAWIKEKFSTAVIAKQFSLLLNNK